MTWLQNSQFNISDKSNMKKKFTIQYLGCLNVNLFVFKILWVMPMQRQDKSYAKIKNCHRWERLRWTCNTCRGDCEWGDRNHQCFCGVSHTHRFWLLQFHETCHSHGMMEALFIELVKTVRLSRLIGEPILTSRTVRLISHEKSKLFNEANQLSFVFFD